MQTAAGTRTDPPMLAEAYRGNPGGTLPPGQFLRSEKCGCYQIDDEDDDGSAEADDEVIGSSISVRKPCHKSSACVESWDQPS